MSKQKTNGSQTNGTGSAEASTALSPEKPAAVSTKTVTGRRLVDRAEQFVIVDDSQPAANVDEPEAEALAGSTLCTFCGIVFADDRWDANAGYCPNCNRDENGELQSEERELSEAELLLQSIENDGEYSLHVERLVNYEADGRADTRAEKRFCTKLKPVTLDYLDIIRREFGGGAYRFSMYRKGVGLVKNGIWVDVIENPIEPPAALPAPPAAAAVAQQPEDPITAITTAAAKLSALKTALVGEELQQLREELKQHSKNNNGGGGPDNPYALFAPLAATNPDLAAKLMDRAFPEEVKGTWMGDLLAHPQEAMALVGMVMSSLQGMFTARGPQPPATGNGHQPQHSALSTQHSALAPSSAVEAGMLIVSTLADDVAKNKRVGRVADLIEEMARKFPEIRQQIDQLLSLDNPGVFQQIQGASGVDLSSYAQAGDFLDELRDELRGPIDDFDENNQPSGDEGAGAAGTRHPTPDTHSEAAHA